MKNNSTYPDAPTRQKRKRSKSTATVAKGAVSIKCAKCFNTFYAVPRRAICPKCNRPANRPLQWFLMLLSLVFPPAGLLVSGLTRPSNPNAALQALLISVVGGIGWGALYYLLLQN